MSQKESRIQYKILKQRVWNVIKSIIIDSHTSMTGLHSVPLYELIWRTFRYRLTNLGIAITNNERKLLKLRNANKNQRAFIIGNGPSLNKCDLSLLKEEITFGVNSIFLYYEKMGFHPTYYIVEDVLVAEDRADEINAYQDPKVRIFGNYLKCFLHDSDNTIWLNVRMNYNNYKDFPHFSCNALRNLWVGGTVTYLCMQLAYYMGFSEVFLVGFDHNYKIPEDVTINNDRFTSQSDDPNHFHPDYFGKGYRWHDPKVDRMEIAYRKAKKYFELDGRKIYNATIGGNLDAFERVNYQDLF